MIQKLIGYTSALPNRTNWENMFRIYPHWRFMLSPQSKKSFGKSREPLLYKQGFAIDNGAYGYYKANQEFDENAFMGLVDTYGHKADFVVIPDFVGNWKKTIDYYHHWEKYLLGFNTLLVAQDGFSYKDAAGIIGPKTGIFLGGTSEFKIKNMIPIGELCKKYGCYYHIGRVNSVKRIRLCSLALAHSFDGSGSSRFLRTSTLLSESLSNINNQYNLFGE